MNYANLTLEQFMAANAVLSVKRIRQQALELGLTLPMIQDKTILLEHYFKMLPRGEEPKAPPPALSEPAPSDEPPFVVCYYGNNPRGYWAARYNFKKGRHEFAHDYFSDEEKAEIRRNAPHLRVQ